MNCFCQQFGSTRLGAILLSAPLAALPVLLIAAWWWAPFSSESPRKLAGGFTSLSGHGEPTLILYGDADRARKALPKSSADLAQHVDFAHENLVQVKWSASGYMTEETVEGEKRLGQPQYGELASSRRRGGAELLLWIHEPTPFWFSGTVHQVFSRQERENWLVVPKGVQVGFVSGGTIHLLDFIMAVALTGIFLVSWRWGYRALRTIACNAHFQNGL
jgi:hypothetical protein